MHTCSNINIEQQHRDPFNNGTRTMLKKKNKREIKQLADWQSCGLWALIIDYFLKFVNLAVLNLSNCDILIQHICGEEHNEENP